MRLRILQGSPQPDPRMTTPPAWESPPLHPLEPPRFAAMPTFKTRRSASFGCSLVAHAAAISAILFLFGPEKEMPSRPLREKYSVRYLQLQPPEPPRRVTAGGSAAGAQAAPSAPAPQAAKVAAIAPGLADSPRAQETAKP